MDRRFKVAAILAAVPEQCVELWHAVKEGEHERALLLHRQLLRLWNAMSGDNLPACVKYVMELQGRASGLPRSPMHHPSTRQKEAIRQAIG